jgi:hypothetical protein
MGDLQPLHPGARRIGAPAPIRTFSPEPVPAEHEQVEVELSGTPSGTLLSPERAFERLERDEQGQRPPFRVA